MLKKTRKRGGLQTSSLVLAPVPILPVSAAANSFNISANGTESGALNVVAVLQSMTVGDTYTNLEAGTLTAWSENRILTTATAPATHPLGYTLLDPAGSNPNLYGLPADGLGSCDAADGGGHDLDITIDEEELAAARGAMKRRGVSTRTSDMTDDWGPDGLGASTYICAGFLNKKPFLLWISALLTSAARAAPLWKQSDSPCAVSAICLIDQIEEGSNARVIQAIS